MGVSLRDHAARSAVRSALDLAALVLAVVLAAGGARAAPGFGPPLDATTGTVYAVGTVAQLKAAVNAANAAGQPATILLANGTYVLDVAALQLACPDLIVRGADGDRDAVVVRGPDTGPGASVNHIFLISAHRVTIADLSLGACRNHGVQIRGEQPYRVAGTRIHNCRLFDCNEQFIKGSSAEADPDGARDGTIEYCLFEFTSGWAYQYYTGGIDIHKGVNWTVRDNLFRNLRTPSAQSGMAEHAVHFWKRCATEPQNVVVERNWIVNCDRGIGFGLGSLDGGHNGGASVIRNNMVVNDGEGAHTDVGIGLEYAAGVQVDNNTVYIPAYWAPIEYRFTGSSNLVFRNNLVNAPIRNRDGAPAPVMSNNVTTAQAAWFRAPAQGDLRLLPSATEAIDRGAALSAEGDDMDGKPRPCLGGWDVGADEFTPAWATSAALPTAPFTDGKTPTREVRVATTGNDATGDGSSARPYATLSRAAQDATPGTAVVLAPGTYAGGTYVADLAGTEQAPIWIRGADPTNRPVLDGGTEGLHLTRVRWLAVENLEVRGCASNGINCDDGGEYANPEATRHVVFRNINIHDIGGTGNQDGLKLSGVNDFLVLDSEFARCGGAGSGSGIDMVGCHGGVVARCYFHDLSANAIQCKGGTAEIDILHCRIFDAGARGINIGGSTGFEYFRPPLSTTATNYEARAIRVVANLFRGGTAAMAFVGAVDCVAANNTIVDPEDWFFRILQETVTAPPYAFHPCGHCGFVNNLVYFDRARLKNPDVNVGPDTLPATFTFARNLWYARNAPGSSEPDLPTAEIHGLLGSDPQLGDPAAGVYTIGLPSPAAQAGANLAAVRTDYGGEDYLAPPSIGAFEIRGDADGDGLPDAWELRHFGVTNATSGLPGEDADGDGFDDRDEFVAGTDPRDSSSCLKITALAADSSGAAVLAWSSVADRTYAVYGATNWPDSGAFVPLADGLRATGTQTGFTTATVRARAALFSVSVRP